MEREKGVIEAFDIEVFDITKRKMMTRLMNKDAEIAAAWERRAGVRDGLVEELEKENVALRERVAVLEEGGEQVINLYRDMRVTIDKVEYYKTMAYGLDNFLFSFPSGVEVGVYNDSSGTIDEVEFE